MSVRQVTVNDRKVWQARVAYRGRRKSTIRPTKGEAKIAEADLLKELQASAAQVEDEEERPATLREAFQAYSKYLEAAGKSIHRVKSTAVAVERLLPQFMDRPLGELTERDLFAFRQARSRQGVKPATTNRDFITIRGMVKRVRPDFRFPRGLFFPEDATRVRWLEPEDEIVFERLRPPFRQIAELAALTLMRLSEIRLLRREAVDLKLGQVHLDKAKAGPRNVTLSAKAQEILRTQLAQHYSEWVFPNPRTGRPYHLSSVSGAWLKAARATGLRDFRFHDLRHHGATAATNAGYKMQVVMALGGWKDPKSMLRYSHVKNLTLRAAAEAVSGNGARQQGANPT